MSFNLSAARTYLAETHLPPLQGFQADAPVGGGMPEFDTDQAQALVIGSDVVSFTSGVEAEFRKAISDSALYAQLVALNKTGGDADAMKFFDAYFAVLLQLGWVVQKRETAEFNYKGDGFDVHEAVIGVVTTFLAPIAGAAAAVLTVLKGLHDMSKNEPFITLFNKRSRHGKIGRFQFTFVHNDPEHGLSAEIMAFALDADDTLTQVLFFRIHKNRTKLRRSAGTFSIDTDALKGVQPLMASKVLAYRTAMIAEADLGPVGGS